jgi:hypothetical protein
MDLFLSMVMRLQRLCPYAGRGRSSALPWEWKRRQTERHKSTSQVCGGRFIDAIATQKPLNAVFYARQSPLRDSSREARVVLFVREDGEEARNRFA